MDLTSKRDIKNLLKKYNIKPSKGLGQNFLIDRQAVRKIIKAAEIKSDDIILEIGPGLGTLTFELAKKAKKVIAVEKDKKMCEILKETLNGYQNINVIEKDILKIFNYQLSIINQFSIINYKVVANLPYYITSPVIRKFLEAPIQPKLMVLTVQREVAQRICAKVPDMNLLAVSVQFYAKPKIISYISKNSFWPSPKVDSSIIKISAFNQHRKSAFNQRFFKIVKAGFTQPRKQVLNNLSKGLKLNKEKTKSILLKNKINPEQRPEALTINDWIKLTTLLF